MLSPVSSSVPNPQPLIPIPQGPIGVFDSGIGGITILREIRKQLPQERCIYLADERENPYGTKPIPRIQKRCEQVVDFLLQQGAKAIVVACNAASVAALGHLRARYSVPFVGIVPGVKPAAGMTQTGVIGVLTTPLTAESEPLARLIEQFARGVKVVAQVCPDLVALVERGVVDGPEVEGALHDYLGTLLGSGADVIVLGCTHYPFLRKAIERIAGPEVTLVDPSDAVVRQLGRVLEARGLASLGPDGGAAYLTTGDLEQFRSVLSRLLGRVGGAIEHVDLEARVPPT